MRSVASARLQFCRIAFGAAGSAGAQIDLGDAGNVAKGFIDDDKVKLTWNLPRVLLPKNRVKLALNMLLIATQAIPRGGTLVIDPIGEGETMGFRVDRRPGLNARVPQAAIELLNGGAEGRAIDAHAIQPFYTGLLAKDCGMTVKIEPEGEAIVVTRPLIEPPAAHLPAQAANVNET